MREMITIGTQSCMTAFMLNIQNIEKLHQQLRAINEILSKQKTDVGIYEYPSSPSLVLHLGELDDKPREYLKGLNGK